MACIITGKKPSQLSDPVVTVDDAAWLVIETSDGKVCRIHPSELAFVSSQEWEFVLDGNFSGTTFTIPLTANGGKLPADDDQIFVHVNGLQSEPPDHWSATRNGVGVQDAIEFVGAKDADRVTVRFPRPV
jgi:acetamidase/formamidase